MKTEKDIEQQLIDAQGAWEAAPSPDLWNRLEGRLDEALPAPRPRRPKNWPFRVLILLLPLAFGLWWLWPDAPATSQPAKPIAARTDFTSPPGNDRLATPTDPETDAHPAPTVGPAINSVTDQLTPVQSAPIALTMGPSGNIPGVVGSNVAAQSSINSAVIQGISSNNVVSIPMGNMYVGKPELEQIIYNLPVGNMLVTNGNGNPIDTVSSVQQFSNLIQSADNNRYLQVNPYRNDLNFNFAGPAAPANQENLQHLKWLLGSWKTVGTSGGAMEEWRQQDEFTLVGRGYFVVNGDTIVTQEMRIEQRGPNVYYIIVKDENAKAMKFRLRSRLSNELIFRDESPKADQELVLRNRPSTNELERIITTPSARSSGPSNGNNVLDVPRSKTVHVLKR